MKRRLYYLLPDAGSARAIMDDLLLARIEERHLHFVAQPGTPMDGLHAANMLQTTDVVHGAQRGILIGTALGCVAGYLFARYVVPDESWQVGIVLLATAFGGLFGGWTASLAGAAIPNTRLAQFADDIARGRVLLIADVPERKVADVRALVERVHPEALGRGLDANVPAFP
jgi:hypothetical protein